MDKDLVLAELVGLTDDLVSLAEEAVSAKEAAETALAKVQESAVTLQKVAAANVEDAVNTLSDASLLPAANRDKIATMLGTHDGALEVLKSVVFLAVAPPSGGTAIAPVTKQAAAVDSRVSRKSQDPDLAIWAELAKTGF
jgi:hypothetical protein